VMDIQSKTSDSKKKFTCTTGILPVREPSARARCPWYGWICIVFLSLIGPVASGQDKSKLNVLFIVSDDLCTDLGCYGVDVKTPNVDKLASRGVRFDRTYCQYPLCGPSRCSFMSGLRPDTTGVLNNGLPVRHKIKDLVTLPELFRHNGYFAARVGKIYHLGIPGEVGKPGPDDPQSWDYTFNPKGDEFSKDGDEYDPDPKEGQSFRRLIIHGEGEKQADHQSAEEAIRLLRANKDKPFFLAVGFIRPHVPELAPEKFFDLYPYESIKLPEMPGSGRDGIPPIAFHYGKLDMGMDERGRRESIRAYHATTSFMDAQVGRVIDELNKLGLADKTIITFISDHGYSLGQHHAWQKIMLFDRVCRVPMIIVPPKTENAGKTCRGIAELVDLYPTVAELAGLKGPQALEGTSVVPLLRDPSGAGKQAAFAQVHRGKTGIGRTIRTDRYRYTEWNAGKDGVELYDEQADPQEYHNLASDPKCAETIRELSERLHAGPEKLARS